MKLSSSTGYFFQEGMRMEWWGRACLSTQTDHLTEGGVKCQIQIVLTSKSLEIWNGTRWLGFLDTTRTACELEDLGSWGPSTGYLKESTSRAVVVAHAFNPSTWEAEAGRFLSSRPAWSTEWVPGQPWLHRENLPWKQKQTNKTNFFGRTFSKELWVLYHFCFLGWFL